MSPKKPLTKRMKRFTTLLGIVLVASLGIIPANAQTTDTDFFQQGVLLLNQGQYKEADTAFSKALKLSSAAKPEQKARILYTFGIVKIQLAQYDAGYQYTEQAIAILEANKLTHLPLFALAYNNLAEVHRYKGEYTKAESLYLRGIKTIEDAQGSDTKNLATLTQNLAEYYRETGQLDKAKPLFDKALTLSVKQYGENSLETARILANTGQYYHDLGNLNQAETFYKRSITIYKTIQKTQHPDYANVLTTLGVLYKQKKQYDLAQQSDEEALEIKKKIYGAAHPEIAISLNNLGMVFLSKGEKEKALDYFEQARTMALQFYDGQHDLVQSIQENIKAAR